MKYTLITIIIKILLHYKKKFNIIGVVLVVFGILVLVHGAALGGSGAGLWAGAGALAAGAFGVVATLATSTSKTNSSFSTAHLAASLIALALSNMAAITALTAIVRDSQRTPEVTLLTVPVRIVCTFTSYSFFLCISFFFWTLLYNCNIVRIYKERFKKLIYKLIEF